MKYYIILLCLYWHESPPCVWTIVLISWHPNGHILFYYFIILIQAQIATLYWNYFIHFMKSYRIGTGWDWPVHTPPSYKYLTIWILVCYAKRVVNCFNCIVYHWNYLLYFGWATRATYLILLALQLYISVYLYATDSYLLA